MKFVIEQFNTETQEWETLWLNEETTLETAVEEFKYHIGTTRNPEEEIRLVKF